MSDTERIVAINVLTNCIKTITSLKEISKVTNKEITNTLPVLIAKIKNLTLEIS